MVGGQEREFGRLRLVALDRDLLAGGEGTGGGELVDVLVHRDHPGTAAGEPDRGVALAAAELKDAAAGHVADQAAVDVGIDAGAQVDGVERSVDVGSPRIVERHAPSLAAARQFRGEGYPLAS